MATRARANTAPMMRTCKPPATIIRGISPPGMATFDPACGFARGCVRDIPRRYPANRGRVSGRADLLFGMCDSGLGGQFDQYFHRSDDWTVEQLDALGAVDAGDRRFGLLLEGILSGETVPDEEGC